MQNRELSWLKFNERVLQEANRFETPLLERLKFISIFASNLDEFFMIRVGALTDYALSDKDYRDNKTDMTAAEQLDEIFRATRPLYVVMEQAFSSVMEQLSRNGVTRLTMDRLSAEELRELENHFIYHVMPLLSPQIIDSRHPFPHIANKRLHIAVTLERKKRPVFGLIAMPAELDRLIFLPVGGCRFVLLEDLILHFSNLVFGVYRIMEKNIVAVTRNADIDTEEDVFCEDIDYRQHMRILLKKRQRLSPVRLEMRTPASPELLEFF